MTSEHIDKDDGQNWPQKPQDPTFIWLKAVSSWVMGPRSKFTKGFSAQTFTAIYELETQMNFVSAYSSNATRS